MKHGGRSHYAGPGKGSQKAAKTPTKRQPTSGSMRQPSGKTNKNPSSAAPKGYF